MSVFNEAHNIYLCIWKSPSVNLTLVYAYKIHIKSLKMLKNIKLLTFVFIKVIICFLLINFGVNPNIYVPYLKPEYKFNIGMNLRNFKVMFFVLF